MIHQFIHSSVHTLAIRLLAVHEEVFWNTIDQPGSGRRILAHFMRQKYAKDVMQMLPKPFLQYNLDVEICHVA